MANELSQRRPPGKKPIKAGFVRSLPFDMPAEQVIKRAAKAGISLSRAYVFQARSTSRGLIKRSEPQPAPVTKKKPLGSAEKAAREWKAKLESDPPPSLPELPAPSVPPAPPTPDLEAVLLAIVTRLGITRARQLIDQHERALRMLGDADGYAQKGEV